MSARQFRVVSSQGRCTCSACSTRERNGTVLSSSRFPGVEYVDVEAEVPAPRNLADAIQSGQHRVAPTDTRTLNIHGVPAPRSLADAIQAGQHRASPTVTRAVNADGVPPPRHLSDVLKGVQR